MATAACPWRRVDPPDEVVQALEAYGMVDVEARTQVDVDRRPPRYVHVVDAVDPVTGYTHRVRMESVDHRLDGPSHPPTWWADTILDDVRRVRRIPL